MSGRAAVCPTCLGKGWIFGTTTEMGCCGNFLSTGECCAAVREANLVPTEVEVQERCPDPWHEAEYAKAEASR